MSFDNKENNDIYHSIIKKTHIYMSFDNKENIDMYHLIIKET